MDPLDTSISPSVSPDVADAIASEFVTGTDAKGTPIHHAAYTTGRGVLSALYETSVNLSRAERDIKAAGMNDPATTDRLRRAATAKMNTARKAGSDALAGLQAHVDQLNAGIDDALGIPTAKVDVCEAGRASDIRAFIRSLPARERPEAIRQAIAGGDLACAAAILSASPLASGISKKEQDFARVDAEEKFCKPAVNLRGSIHRMIGLIETAMGSTEKRFGGLCGVGDSPAAVAARSLAAIEGGQQ